ncbi:AHH domain-containing protein [Kamptonema formosum]|uniref:AHH domain-containing protein n=1 Tax=Kamptonema formosum TaxID=331992 RepID=UPI0008FC19EB
MQDAGVIFNPGDEAHHIVASTHRRAQEARDILDRYGIDINDANNGIPLPNHLHHGRGLHSYRGIDEVRIRLRAATSRDEAIEILTQISDEIRSGTFPTQP